MISNKITFGYPTNPFEDIRNDAFVDVFRDKTCSSEVYIFKGEVTRETFLIDDSFNTIALIKEELNGNGDDELSFMELNSTESIILKLVSEKFWSLTGLEDEFEDEEDEEDEFDMSVNELGHYIESLLYLKIMTGETPEDLQSNLSNLLKIGF